MQSVDLAGIEKLDRELATLLEEVPERRRKLHEQIAEVIKSEVDTQISIAGINDSSGHIRDWQKPHVGSGGGYASVRADDKSTGDNSHGAITNYLENGHKIREPSGKGKKYRPHIKKSYVDGFHFYSAARNAVESKAIATAEGYVKEIMEKLEG